MTEHVEWSEHVCVTESDDEVRVTVDKDGTGEQLAKLLQTEASKLIEMDENNGGGSYEHRAP